MPSSVHGSLVCNEDISTKLSNFGHGAGEGFPLEQVFEVPDRYFDQDLSSPVAPFCVLVRPLGCRCEFHLIWDIEFRFL